jgi:hypothetical protein
VNFKGLAPEVGTGDCQLSHGRLTPTGDQRMKDGRNTQPQTVVTQIKKHTVLAGNRTSIPRSSSRSPITIMTELSRFSRVLKSQETIIYIFYILRSILSSGKNL